MILKQVLLRVYPGLVLLGLTFLAPRRGLLAAALLLAGLWALDRGGRRARVTVYLACVLAVPVLAEPALSAFVSAAAYRALGLDFSPAALLGAALAIPIIPGLDTELARGAAPPAAAMPGRRLTPAALFLLAAASAALFTGWVLSSGALFLAAAAALLYAAVRLLWAWYLLRGTPLRVAPGRLRAVAGENSSIKLKTARRPGVLAWLASPLEWLTMGKVASGQERGGVNVLVRPVLSGPAEPEMIVYATDSRGLLSLSYKLRPLTLEVIPRARYARHLAERFLAGQGDTGPTGLEESLRAAIFHRRGLEYESSREYRPGDRLKDIDFKHSLKFGQLIAKSYARAAGSACLLAGNLTAGSAGEADEVGCNLIAAALTLAREGIPAGLALYNRQGVLAVAPAREPREVLRQVLFLAGKIEIVADARRRLAPPEVGRLKSDLRLLAGNSAAGKLREMLEFQWGVLRHSADNAPVSTALRGAARSVKAPALVLMASRGGPDAGAAVVVLHELAGQRYTVLDLTALQGKGSF